MFSLAGLALQPQEPIRRPREVSRRAPDHAHARPAERGGQERRHPSLWPGRGRRARGGLGAAGRGAPGPGATCPPLCGRRCACWQAVGMPSFSEWRGRCEGRSRSQRAVARAGRPHLVGSFRPYPDIDAWLSQLHPQELQRSLRFRPLLWRGRSRTGKTCKAQSFLRPARKLVSEFPAVGHGVALHPSVLQGATQSDVVRRYLSGAGGGQQVGV